MVLQIRFARPNPQHLLFEMFRTGAISEKKMMIIVDGYFRGHPDYVRPDLRIPTFIKDGEAAIEKGFEIFKETLQLLKTNGWEFEVHSDIGMDAYFEIMKKFTKKEIKVLKFKLKKANARSLIVFGPKNGPGDFGMRAISAFLKEDRQVCVVDPWGVKRYPRPH